MLKAKRRTTPLPTLKMETTQLLQALLWDTLLLQVVIKSLAQGVLRHMTSKKTTVRDILREKSWEVQLILYER